MRVLIQRVAHATCTVDNEVTGQIEKGYCLLVGFEDSDNEQIIEKIADKIINLRINDDPDGKMNLAIQDVKGDILSISQFTLYANSKKGRRPSFDESASGEVAKPMYERFNEILRNKGMKVETGIFAAEMKIDLCNDGPITIWLDSKEL